MYKAKYAFEGQDGEMSLEKDDVVELLQKDDNGWWLMKKGGIEGWAPHNYLELVPPKAAAPAAPPPPPRTRPVPTPTPKVTPMSVTANANAKPVSVFPGMVPANGTATPWKKSAAPATASVDTSRSSTPTGNKVPPPVASKPKPHPPSVAAKPGAPKAPPVAAKSGTVKPPVPPAAARPTPVSSGKSGAANRPAIVGGQMDLAAAVSSFNFLPLV
jgi:myosin-1